MSETQTTLPIIKWFRVTAFALACILGGLGTWILVAEILRPEGIEFTTDSESAASIFPRRDAAVLAARVGRVRGDLWSDAAFAYGGTLLNQKRDVPNGNKTTLERTRALTERAIAFAPHDSRIWILIAAYYFHTDWPNEKAMASLKMSYYTGSNTIEVVPERLLLALQSHALQDDEFQELVRHDIQMAVVRKSQLLPVLVAAYRSAPLMGRQFLEKTLAEFDPGVLAAIVSKG